MDAVAMSMSSLPQRSWPIGLLVLLAVAVPLYGLMLANAVNQPSGGGEAGLEAALEGLFLTAGLWIVLVIMIIVGAVRGTMPGWAGGLAGILFPASGVANFTAVDLCSRRMPWAIVVPILLAPLDRLLRLLGGMAEAAGGVAGRAHQRRGVGVDLRSVGRDVRAGGLSAQRSMASKARIRRSSSSYL